MQTKSYPLCNELCLTRRKGSVHIQAIRNISSLWALIGSESRPNLPQGPVNAHRGQVESVAKVGGSNGRECDLPSTGALTRVSRPYPVVESGLRGSCEEAK